MASNTATVPRKKIPQKMWDLIADADRRAKFLDKTIRQEIIDVGATHGFSKTELVLRGIITARPDPDPDSAIAGEVLDNAGATR